MDARAFKAMLQFIYTDTLPKVVDDGGDDVAMTQHLLVAADRYGIERLKAICEERLLPRGGGGGVVVGMVAATLALAEQHGCR
uniref:BTB domain-containing protein n=1 Tax=Leersia perrieri TaxID=77586 RepID=A0A0D9XU97_9ORYZ